AQSLRIVPVISCVPCAGCEQRKPYRNRRIRPTPSGRTSSPLSGQPSTPSSPPSSCHLSAMDSAGAVSVGCAPSGGGGGCSKCSESRYSPPPDCLCGGTVNDHLRAVGPVHKTLLRTRGPASDPRQRTRRVAAGSITLGTS